MEYLNDVNSIAFLQINSFEDLIESKKNYLKIKYFLDKVFALFILIVFSPLIIFTGFLVWLSRSGSIIFIHRRVGHLDKEFDMYKFRSMYSPDIYNPAPELYEQVKQGNFDKRPDDPRITKIGRFIRKYSLDEFPQFWNVLKGEMSIIGPRPSELYLSGTDYQRRIRTLVKPGITGLWQVSDRANCHISNMFIYDLKYIENLSFMLDLKILFKTIFVVFKGKDAF
jgi:lipopolysaccharide/colanic/teichoic acid biosynthesis glycosyltransferase